MMKKSICFICILLAVLATSSCTKEIENGGNCNGHEFVDLGLPSGTLWATCNVGATSPEGYGDYFAWGETTTKDRYDGSNYRHWIVADGMFFGLTKYCNYESNGYEGYTDNLTTLLTEDDAASVNWGDGWCTPSAEQWRELMDNTITQWVVQNNVEGRMFTARNGLSIFLPAAGYRSNESQLAADSCGCYWSNSLYSSNYNDEKKSYVCWFINGYYNDNVVSFNVYVIFDYYNNYRVLTRTRGVGLPVRPVRSTSQK